MHIVCPHCTTYYAIDLATLGAAGRTVRCSRCKEVWLARPEDAIETLAPASAMAAANQPASAPASAARWSPAANDDIPIQDIPLVASPSISSDLPTAEDGTQDAGLDSPPAAPDGTADAAAMRPPRPSWLRKFLTPPAGLSAPGKSLMSLPTACAAMGALVLALTIWRVEVVRLLPQTAMFYKMVGFDINVRGLAFKDVKITTETVDGKPVLVIEGVIVGEARRPVEVPRVRFSVTDARGAEIYAWNAVLDQRLLKPGERAWFKSRLASPPPEGRQLDMRFFGKHDIGAGTI